MRGTVAKLGLLMRAEVLRGRIAARSFAVRACFYGLAALLAVLGVVMLVLAVYLALAEEVGPVYGALLTAVGLGVLALVLALLARPLSRARDAKAADELERAIRAELVHELQVIEVQMKAVPGSLAGLAALGRGPLGVLAFAVGVATAFSPRLRGFFLSLLR